MMWKINILVASIFMFCCINTYSADKEYKVKNFNKVELKIAANVMLGQGDNCYLKIEGDQEDLENIIVEVDDDKLLIKHKKSRRASGDKMNITLNVKEIEGFKISGSGNVKNATPIKADELDLDISGSGNFSMDDISFDELEAKISGSGDIFLKGDKQASSMEIKISGSGKWNTERLKTKKLSISISGSGSSKIWVTKELSAKISGSGKIYYKGKAKVDANVSGSGKIKSMD